MTDVMQMSAEELNEAILREMGYVKLPLPAVPSWQKPGRTLYTVPQYSTSIAAAWKLVEDMRQTENIEVYLYSGFDGFRVTVMDAKWNGEDETRLVELASSTADTAPLAISRAWLLWKRQG